jgi:hypothetical protein
LQEACETGERQLWIVQKGSCFVAAAITDTFHEPFKTIIEFVAVGGREMDEWVHFEKQITGMAKKDIGAAKSRIDLSTRDYEEDGASWLRKSGAT